MGYASRIRQLISEFRLEDRVIWTGLLNDQEKMEALESADVTVYPSKNEVFGLVPLESICAGTPVIVCDDDGCGEVIRLIGGGDLVPWADITALQNAIQRRLMDGKNRDELLRSQEKIRSYFNWHLVGKKVEKFYENCIAGKTEGVLSDLTPMLK
jgi:glycosyltransferase involved in cell wall biosynthesis